MCRFCLVSPSPIQSPRIVSASFSKTYGLLPPMVSAFIHGSSSSLPIPQVTISISRYINMHTSTHICDLLSRYASLLFKLWKFVSAGEFRVYMCFNLPYRMITDDPFGREFLTLLLVNLAPSPLKFAISATKC